MMFPLYKAKVLVVPCQFCRVHKHSIPPVNQLLFHWGTPAWEGWSSTLLFEDSGLGGERAMGHSVSLVSPESGGRMYAGG